MPSLTNDRTAVRLQTRRAFTLVELILTLLVVTCLIGLTIRAQSEADRLALGLQSPRVLTFDQKALVRRTLREQSVADSKEHDAEVSVPNIVQTSEAPVDASAPQATMP